MKLDITITEPADPLVSSANRTIRLDECDEPTQHAALRAIAEHLGPETVREVLGAGFDDNEAARWQRRIEETIRAAGLEPFDASGNESGDPLDWSADQLRYAFGELTGDAQATKQAIRAAGYDPQKVSAAEAIRRLHQHLQAERHAGKLREQERDSARGQLASARAQLREWRETVGPIDEAAELAWKASDSERADRMIKFHIAYGTRRDDIRRLLSATPDDARSPEARAAEREIDRIAEEQTGKVEPMVPAAEVEQMRKRVEELEACRKDAEARATQWVRERDRALETQRSAEAAVEAMRPVVAAIVERINRGVNFDSANVVIPIDEARRLTRPAVDALAAYTAIPADQSQCSVSPFSSRVCERGTKGCDWAHVDDSERWRSAYLDRESVRRLRDWITAWLGKS